MKKQPEVTAQTRKRLIDAFWTLYANERLEKISIGSITKIAGLNRGTFYEYFTDIYDLLEQMEEELLQNLMEQMDARLIEKMEMEKLTIENINLTDLTRILTQIFSAYDDKFFILLSKQGDTEFQEKLKEKIGSHLITVMHLSNAEKNVDYLVTFIVSCISGMFTYWFENGKNKNLEELLYLMQLLIGSGVFGYLKSSPVEYYSAVLEYSQNKNPD